MPSFTQQLQKRFKKINQFFGGYSKISTFAAEFFAQMAELVDALVSNTSEAIRAGSIPALGTRKKAKYLIIQYLAFYFA